MSLFIRQDGVRFDGYVPKEKYYEYWIQSRNDYIVLIHSILTDSHYKLLNISFTYRKSKNDYLMKIYYSINDSVKIYNVILWNEIRTDIKNFKILLDTAHLYISYAKYEEIKPDIEYYTDISELLSSISVSEMNKGQESRKYISYMTGEEFTEEEFLKMTLEEVRKKALEREK